MGVNPPARGKLEPRWQQVAVRPAPCAAADIRDLRGLIDAWREARRTAWQTAVKVVTTGVLAALLVGVAIKLRLMGGPQ